MARTVRDAKLETRAARARLAPGPTPHFKTLKTGELHLGYRRKHADRAGEWFARRRVGDHRYRITPLGLADDFEGAAEGIAGISFEEAMRRALDTRAVVEDVAKELLTVRHVIESYVEWLQIDRPAGRAARDVAQRAGKLILPQLGDIKVTDLTTRQLTRWRDDLALSPALLRSKKRGPQNFRKTAMTAEQKRKRKVSTNRVITDLKAALNRAFKQGQVNDDAQWKRLEAFRKVDAARTGYLTMEEAQRFINAADAASGFRDLVLGALHTGARYGELCAMRVGDFYRGKLAVYHSKTSKHDHLALSDEAVEFFEQITKARAREAFMFLRPEGPWKKGMQDGRMRKLCAAARIEPRIGFHQLRHTWASHAVMNGMPLIVVARNLGHANTTQVEKHYGHLAESYIDRAIKDHAPKFGVVKSDKVVAIRAKSPRVRTVAANVVPIKTG